MKEEVKDRCVGTRAQLSNIQILNRLSPIVDDLHVHVHPLIVTSATCTSPFQIWDRLFHLRPPGHGDTPAIQCVSD